MMLLPLGAFAQRTDIIVTRDGNKYEGYLARQVPNKSVTIFSTRTTITVAQRDAEIINRRVVMLGDLPEECLSLFPLLSDEAYVEQADVVTVEGWDGRKIDYRKAVLLETGENLKFVSFAPQAFELDWSQLKSSSKVPYDFTRMIGFRDHLLFPSARIIEGQLMEQDLRSGILKFRQTDGAVTTYHKSNVQAVRYQPADPDANIWEQVPYCDKIYLRDSTSHEGLIISKLFGKTVEIQLFNSNLTETVPVTEIEAYEKFKNPLFKQKYDIPEYVERYADLYVNGESRPVGELRHNKNKTKYFVLDEADSSKIFVNARERVVVKYRAESRTSRFLVAKARLTKEAIYGVSWLKVNNKGTELHPVFAPRDIIAKPDINFQANEGGFIVADFVLPTAGAYVFFVEGSEQCFVIYAQ